MTRGSRTEKWEFGNLSSTIHSLTDSTNMSWAPATGQAFLLDNRDTIRKKELRELEFKGGLVTIKE